MPATATTAITPAGPADVPALTGALARAFHDDPVLAWVVPDPDRRRATLPSVFAAFADVYLPYHETYVAGDGVSAALWAPPGAEPFDGQAGEAFAEQMAAVLGEDAERAATINALLEQHHPAEPCFYLQFVGVVPEQQGRGLGSRLLTSVLQRCDAAGAAAALEATSVRNRRLYRRHGFDVLDEVTLPQGPPLWPMWREPATAAPEPRRRRTG